MPTVKGPEGGSCRDAAPGSGRAPSARPRGRHLSTSGRWAGIPERVRRLSSAKYGRTWSLVGDLAAFRAPGGVFGGHNCIGPGHRRKCCQGRQNVPGGRLCAGCSTWERLCVVGQAPEALSGRNCVVGGGSPARSGATDKLSWPDIDLFRRLRRFSRSH